MDRRLIEQFGLFDTSIVSDALDDFDVRGVINGIPPAHPDHYAVGPVTTVSFEPAPDPGEATNFPYAMLEAFEEGHVLLIDGVADDISCWGGRASQLADNAGIAGVIVDGGFRDVDSIRRERFPVFGRASTPLTGQRRIRVSGVDDPVDIDGVSIHPGDLVVADATGIVVVPQDLVEPVLERADEILARELLLEAKIDNGATVAELKADEHEF